jgi:hypothetical protein
VTGAITGAVAGLAPGLAAGLVTGAVAGALTGAGPDGIAAHAQSRPEHAIITARLIAADKAVARMWVIYLEAGVVLTLVILIVWWTMRGKK